MTKICSFRAEAISYLGPGTQWVRMSLFEGILSSVTERQISIPLASRVSGSAFKHPPSHNNELPISGIIQGEVR